MHGLWPAFVSDPDILISNCQDYAKICVQLAVTQQAVCCSSGVVVAVGDCVLVAPCMPVFAVQGLIAETFSPPAEEFVWTSNLSEGERVRVNTPFTSLCDDQCFTCVVCVLRLQGGNWSNPFVSFECLFAFVAVAAAYTRKASTTVFADPSGPTLLEASRLYRTAAGYLDFALNNVVPTLRNRGSAKYPSEVQTPVLQALSAVCMAQVCLHLCGVLTVRLHGSQKCSFFMQAQQCAILKSDADGKPKSLLAKLEAGLQTQYADALRCLNSLVCGVSVVC